MLINNAANNGAGSKLTELKLENFSIDFGTMI